MTSYLAFIGDKTSLCIKSNGYENLRLNKHTSSLFGIFQTKAKLLVFLDEIGGLAMEWHNGN